MSTDLTTKCLIDPALRSRKLESRLQPITPGRGRAAVAADHPSHAKTPPTQASEHPVITQVLSPYLTITCQPIAPTPRNRKLESRLQPITRKRRRAAAAADHPSHANATPAQPAKLSTLITEVRSR